MTEVFLYRRIIEKVTRNWVFRRRLPKEVGGACIFVSPSAGLKFLFRSMHQTDPILFRNVKEIVREGNVVWDIGANVGLFSFSAAAIAGKAGKIIAFEPDTWLIQLLRRSVSIQPEAFAPVTVVPSAVASEVGLRQFEIASRARAANALAGYGSTQMGGVLEKHTCTTLSLDWLAEKLPWPDVIKCDVEGAEVEVFKGQEKMLDKIRPVIICEISHKVSEEITAIFKKHKFKLFDGDRPLSEVVEVEKSTWNTIAIPEEKIASFSINLRSII